MERTLELVDEAALLEPRLALRECRPLVATLADAVRERVARLSEQATGRDPVFETLARAEAWSLELFRWPVGAKTPIHDHTSWGIYVCLAGQLGEERYVRLDDGSQLSVAHLRKAWARAWQPAQQSTLLPYEGGIHRVRNASLTTAVSLHLYGPRLSAIDGRDYEPGRDFVCDRPLAA